MTNDSELNINSANHDTPDRQAETTNIQPETTIADRDNEKVDAGAADVADGSGGQTADSRTEASDEEKLANEAKALDELGRGLKERIPRDVFPFFRPWPILIGESAARYMLLLGGLITAITPRDLIEWLWLKDICHYSWDIDRLQAVKRVLVILESHQVYIDTCGVTSPPPVLDRALKTFFQKGYFEAPSGKKILNQVLETVGETDEAIRTRAVSKCVAKLSAIDSLIGTATIRRDKLFREIDRRRESVVVPCRRPFLSKADVVPDGDLGLH